MSRQFAGLKFSMQMQLYLCVCNLYRYLIRPYVLRDVSNVDLSTTVLGNKISFPVGVSPTAMQCMAHPDGEKATARGIFLTYIYISFYF